MHTEFRSHFFNARSISLVVFFAPITTMVFRALMTVPKHTSKTPNSTLDLSYITPQLVVSGGPTDSKHRAVFRDNVAHVVAYLDLKHGRGNWHVWNLRAEGEGYALNGVIGPHCSYRPIVDHEIPPLEFMEKLMVEIHNFLDVSSERVALIHCKQGMGRSGTICCGYLMYQMFTRGIYASVDEMVAKFTAKRMKKVFGPGVSIESQLRFLRYWKVYMELPPDLRQDFALAGSDQRSCILQVEFEGPQRLLWRLRLALATHKATELEEIFSTSFQNNIGVLTSPLRQFCSVDLNVPLANLPLVRVQLEAPVARCHFWFSPYLETIGSRKRPIAGLDGNMSFLVSWNECDGRWGTKWKGVPLFEKITVSWMYKSEEDDKKTADNVV